jgi:hypothetical protein
VEQVTVAVTLLNRIREVFGSNLGRDLGYPDLRFIVVFFFGPSSQVPG